VPGTPSQPLSKADKNGTGANPGTTCTHAYCSTRDGSASQNGNGGGTAGGKPCAGCVGKADNKNPKGQYPNGSDHNNGYECDGNNGIGRGNPAHTACKPTPAPTSTSTSKPSPTPTRTATDACPNMPGKQKPGTVCSTPTPTPTKTKTPTPTATPTVTDACPNMPGNQPAGTNCNPKDKITICHATGSATNPYVIITISKNGLNGHGKHERDIIPAGAGGVCPGGSTPTATPTPTPTSTPPFDACPNMTGNQPAGTPCTTGGGGGGGSVPLCPNGQVMPNGNPANCPTNPPVCPTNPVMGPVMAGCNPLTPPVGVGGGGGTVVPPVVNPPVVNPPVVNPPVVNPPVVNPPVVVPPVGPPTRIPPAVRPPAVRPNTAVAPAVITRPAAARPSTLPFTGTDAALLVELGALLLLAGGGVLLVTRRERLARR
jgi:hypothetical protein